MKFFISKFVLFLLLLFGGVIAFEQITSRVIVEQTNFELKSHPQYLVLGHSQSEYAFNDSLINNLVNQSGSGESYFYTYHKSKSIIVNNPSIETIFITYANNCIDTKMDKWTWDCYFMRYRLEKFSPLISFKGKLKLAYHNPKCFLQSMSFVLKERLNQLRYGELVYSKRIGGYKNSVQKVKPKTELTPEEKRIKELNRYDPGNMSISTVNIFYLEKLIDFCYKNGKTVVLIRPPQRADYEYWGNEVQFQNLKGKAFEEIPFLDLSVFHLDDEEYLDASHLNSLGAKRFSVWFNGLLTTQPEELVKGYILPANLSQVEN